MRSTVILVLATFAVTGAGCYQSTEFGEDDEPDVAMPDAHDGTDAPAETADEAEPEDAGEEAAPFCGDEKEPRTTLSFIVDGQETFDPSVVVLEDGEVLAVGAMLQRDWMSGEFTNSCSATLVADATVLTAAHCVLGWTGTARPEDLRFAIGTDILEPVYTFEIAEVHVNPEYRPRMGEEQARGDQAVLILAESAAAAVPEIRPIPVNREPLPDEFLGTRVQNAGYGSTEPRGGGGNTLRWWTTEEVTTVTDYDYVVNGAGVSSVCFGDSGGPGMWTFPDGEVRVAGTVSWGDPSCVDYDHFARTDYNVEFLLPFIGEEDPCGGLTWEGRCDPGDFAVWCVDGVTYRRDCAACGQTCGDAGPSLGMYCL